VFVTDLIHPALYDAACNFPLRNAARRRAIMRESMRKELRLVAAIAVLGFILMAGMALRANPNDTFAREPSDSVGVADPGLDAIPNFASPWIRLHNPAR
jgi:hypothetical protein